jgi:Flp pilus assembly protein CpaB
VTENDHVDLIWSTILEYQHQIQGADGKPTWEKAYFTSTKTLLQDVHVMRVVKLLQAPPPSGQNNGNGSAEAASAVSTDNSASLAAMYAEGAPYATVLVLGVTDQQAEVLAFARDNGTVDLTLRSSAVQKDDTGNVVKDDQGHDVRGDKEVEKTTGIGIDTLIQQYGLPVPKSTGP